MAQKIIKVSGRALPFEQDDVDTDEIAPTKESLYILSWEEAADIFCYKSRYNPDGSLKNHVLNYPDYAGARILFAGKNFGSGSSREHAPQGTKARYDAVVAVSFAPIFADNAYAIGLPALVAESEHMQTLMASVRANPNVMFNIDLERRIIHLENTSEIPLILDDAKRAGFLEGKWDEREILEDGLNASMEKIRKLPSIAGYDGVVPLNSALDKHGLFYYV